MNEDWYYGLSGETLGPVAFEKLLSILKKQPDWTAVPVWRDGLGDWRWARDVHQIAFQFGRAAVPGAQTPRAPETAAASGTQSSRTPSSQTTSLQTPSPQTPSSRTTSSRKIWIAAAIGLVALAIAAGAMLMLWPFPSPLERAFAAVVRDTKPALPKKADELTSLSDVTSSGTRLVYQHIWDAPTFAIPPNPGAAMKARKLAEVCAGAQDIFKLSGEVEYIYRSRSGLFIGSFVVTASDCR